jgi:hypothetical protein
LAAFFAAARRGAAFFAGGLPACDSAALRAPSSVVAVVFTRIPYRSMSSSSASSTLSSFSGR